jgi:hypothetical protein
MMVVICIDRRRFVAYKNLCPLCWNVMSILYSVERPFHFRVELWELLLRFKTSAYFLKGST